MGISNPSAVVSRGSTDGGASVQIVDSLDSTSATAALSAKQGKALATQAAQTIDTLADLSAVADELEANKADIRPPVTVSGNTVLTRAGHANRPIAYTGGTLTVDSSFQFGDALLIFNGSGSNWTPGFLTPTVGMRSVYAPSTWAQLGFDGSAWRSDDPLVGSGTNTVFTSSTCTSGAILDQGSTTYGSDQTAALQAILDRATSAPLLVIWDGAYSTTGLNIRSNTTIRVLPGCGAILRPNSGRALWQNQNQTGGTIVDHDITIDGGVWNGNRGGGSSGSSDPRQNQAGEWIMGMRFAGVRNLRVLNQRFVDCPTYAVLAGNLDTYLFDNIDVSVPNAIYNCDGVHIIGPAKRGRILNFTGHGLGDDLVSICADDGNIYQDGLSAIYGPNLTQGPITDIVVDGVHADNCRFGARLLSHVSRLDRAVVRNITGTYQAYPFLCEDLENSSAGVVMQGNFGSVVLDGVDVEIVPSTGYGRDRFIFIGDHIEQMTIRNVKRRGVGGGTRPLISINPGADIGRLLLSDISLDEASSADAAAQPIQMLGGHVDQLLLSGVSWLQSGFSGAQKLISGSGSIGVLAASNYAGPSASDPSRLVAGTVAVGKKTGDAFGSVSSAPSTWELEPGYTEVSPTALDWTAVSTTAPAVARKLANDEYGGNLSVSCLLTFSNHQGVETQLGLILRGAEMIPFSTINGYTARVVERGTLSVDIGKLVDGVFTTVSNVAEVTSGSLDGVQFLFTFSANGSSLAATLKRVSDGMYFKPDGSFSSTPGPAATATDTTFPAASGGVGLFAYDSAVGTDLSVVGFGIAAA